MIRDELGARPVEDRGPAELGDAQPCAELAGAVAALAAWLDRTTGRDAVSLTCAVAKVAEESGEAVAAWINYVGSNPRKPAGDVGAVVAELGDVALSALVALARLGVDPVPALAERAACVVDRAGLELKPAPAVSADLLPGVSELPAAPAAAEVGGSFVHRLVVEIHCVECGQPADDGEQGALWFQDPAAALRWVTVNNDLDGPGGPWRVLDAGRLVCGRCVVTAECAELGHEWSAWYRHPRDPNTGQRERLRECSRCWRVEYAAPSSAPRLVSSSAPSSAGAAGPGETAAGSELSPVTATQGDSLDTGARFVVISGGSPSEARGDGGCQ
jgi:hypothetical protein